MLVFLAITCKICLLSMQAGCACLFATEPVLLPCCRIEGGYRACQAKVLSLLRQHPGSIVSANAGYWQQLCSLLCMEVPHSLTQPASTSEADAAGEQVAGSSAVQPAVRGSDAGVMDCTATGALPQLKPGIAVGPVEFKPKHDLYVRFVAEPLEAAVATAEQTAADAAKAVAKAKADAIAADIKAGADAIADAAAAAAAAAADQAKPRKGGKDTKGGKDAKLATADKGGKGEKSGKADKGGKADKTAADAAAAEPPQPEFKFEFEGVKAPKDRSGAVLCREEAVPESAIRHVLQTLQKHFLEDMVFFCEEAETSGHNWAGEEEVAATEQLEARLRSHRYSCGAHLVNLLSRSVSALICK